jgi:hypothetical protein
MKDIPDKSVEIKVPNGRVDIYQEIWNRIK